MGAKPRTRTAIPSQRAGAGNALHGGPDRQDEDAQIQRGPRGEAGDEVEPRQRHEGQGEEGRVAERIVEAREQALQDIPLELTHAPRRVEHRCLALRDHPPGSVEGDVVAAARLVETGHEPLAAQSAVGPGGQVHGAHHAREEACPLPGQPPVRVEPGGKRPGEGGGDGHRSISPSPRRSGPPSRGTTAATSSPRSTSRSA